MSKMISRDPFAREELHRENEHDLMGHTCEWCGNVKSTPKGKKYLYRYFVETDSGRKSEIAGLFCSVGCMRIYNGG